MCASRIAPKARLADRLQLSLRPMAQRIEICTSGVTNMSQPNHRAPVHAPTLLAAADHDGPLWSTASDQLNANLLRFSAGQGIAAHVNNEGV
jgi:hypothetical protein